MDIQTIKRVLEEVEKGKKSAGDALSELRHLSYSDLDVCRHDSHRSLRNGFSEVILCEGKDTGHLVRIVRALAEKGVNIFGTRADEEVGRILVRELSNVLPAKKGMDYDRISRTFCILNKEIEPSAGKLAVICAGTADIPIAEEARRTASFFGIEAKKFYDVGVAGLHRLVSCLNDLNEADCAIVAAGMEGALPSVVGGLISCPIVSVPTSVGYGANLKGFSALLTMLNSCSEGITVVNIDNGFGAACAALRILRKVNEARKQRIKETRT
jgi:NCAIR mutase (PurE)-related protein